MKEDVELFLNDPLNYSLAAVLGTFLWKWYVEINLSNHGLQ